MLADQVVRRLLVGGQVGAARGLQMDASAARFAEIYDALLAELQEKMIKARPKQRFVRPDLPL